MLPDEKLVNTIKLIALKNALDFDNNIKLNVVISKTFSFLKNTDKNSIKGIVPEINKIVSELSLLPLDAKKSIYDSIFNTSDHYLNNDVSQESEIRSESKGNKEKIISKEKSFDNDSCSLPPLNNASYGNVTTRFPPEPNGYPHIGHAKAAIIDEEYAKRYGGKLILRFDDTNPAKEKLDYYDAILNGLRWLNVKPSVIKNTSDDIEKLYECGRNLIKKNCAYICECNPDLIKFNRSNGVSCICSTNKVETNSNEFENMILGKYKQNECIVRYRGNMKSLNTAMRDPTLFRIIEEYHPKLGNKHYLWPTYDLAAPIEDSLDGVTHAFRTKEYELRNELYFAILSDLNLPKPQLIEFSRLEFEGIPVSKRKITPLIDKGIIKQWDDPRLPTLVALKRRGILPQAIRKFVISLGITLSETKPSMEILESFNRKILDPLSLRLFFVKDPVKVQIDELDFDFVEIKNHPTLDMGKRKIDVEKIIYISNDDAIKLKIGDTVRLMDLCNVEVVSINSFGNEEKTEKIIKVKNKGDEISHNIQKIQWVSKKSSIEFKVIKPLPLYNGDYYNENNLIVDKGLCESSISFMKIGTPVQFVRYGFCRLDDVSTAIFTHK